MVLPIDKEYIVIGDVHGCIDELKTLLAKHDFHCDKQELLQLNPKNRDKSIVLLGDFIDKANEEKLTQTIQFIHQNYHYLNKQEKHFYLILGNHEEKVYQYITNDPSLEINDKTIKDKKKYYNTVALLEKNSSLKKLFIELYHLCEPWLYYHYNRNFSVTLTHAPCPEKHLRKGDRDSRNKMIKCISRSKNPKVALDALIPYVHKEAKDTQHYHIFGHLSQSNIRKYKNKICIDTSAIYGGRLSSAIIKENSLSFDSVPFEKKQKAGVQRGSQLFNFTKGENVREI